MAKLLVVDDEEDVRDFITNFFSKRKIEVKSAESGEKALGLLEKEKVNLVLLDIKMDGIDGVETLRRIKNTDRNIKVIMVTSRKPDEENSLAECRQLGALDYIHKPLELDELERVVIKTLRKP